MTVTPRPQWPDHFFQYRIPVDVFAEVAGWHQVPLDEARITAAVNAREQFKYDPDFFAYNYLTLWDESAPLDGGFTLVPDGPPQKVPLPPPPCGSPVAMFEGITGQPPAPREGDTVSLSVRPHHFYLLRYTAWDGGSSPALDYEPVFPVGCLPRKHGYRISYEPRLLRRRQTEYQTLLVPDDDTLRLRVRGEFVTKLLSLSLQKVQIRMLVRLERPGPARLFLYYQPMCSHYLMVPDRRRQEMPRAQVRIDHVGPAEKYLGRTSHRLVDDPDLTVWFADTTVKLTPETPAPEPTQPAVVISSASNERVSFQLVLRPQTAVHLESICASDLAGAAQVIPARQFEFRRLDYVPVRKSSEITPARHLGWIGDPLVPVEACRVAPETGNHVLWVTVDVGASTAAGVYAGELRLTLAGRPPLTIDLRLEVHGFSLPEVSPFEADMGGFHLHKSIDGGAVVADYHAVKTKKDLKRLANAYFEEMARNKFTPKNVALYTEIGMKWQPPPHGYNVDRPDNHFRLYDWDFTRFNRQLDHFVNKLKVNQVTIYHTNPQICNVFVHLPGKKRKKLERVPIRHTLVTGGQTYREATYVAYGDIDESHPVYGHPVIRISRGQYDHLVLEFFRAIAQNMDEHGWLDYATIMVDEMPDEPQLLHFLKLLKSDPLTARIKVGVCLQSLDYLYYKENEGDGDYAFNGRLDFYMPELCENYNRWDDHFFGDYRIPRQRRRLIPYVITTSRSAIDAPGVNNRLIGLDVFRRGGGGYLIWDTIVWDHPYGDHDRRHCVLKNPWVDPYVRHANGALSYFYPPRRDGLASKPDFTITPSARVMNFRKAVDDFEYAWLLEKAVEQGRQRQVDTAEGERVLRDVSRFFHNPVHWSQNDAWYLELRQRMAKQIVALQAKRKGVET